MLNLTLTSGISINDTWDFVKEKTWFSRNGWAGEQVVFYKTENGLNKALIDEVETYITKNQSKISANNRVQ